MTHYCLSSHMNQLLRWQQAFPGGRVASSLDKLLNSVREKTVVWVHSDCLSPGALVETIASLTRHQNVDRVVVISSVPNVQETADALAAGATGYCHVMATPELFCKIATVVSNGGFWVGSEFIDQLAGSVSRSLAPAESMPEPEILERLSTREREVALQVKKGASNKEIAAALDITERTVKAHLGSIFQKFEIRDRLQLSLLLSHNPS